MLSTGECTPDLSVLEPESGQMTREDMIGVLYIVYVGMGVAVICVLIELCVASFWEVDPTDPRVSTSTTVGGNQ